MKPLKARIFDSLIRNRGMDLYAQIPIFAQNVVISAAGEMLRRSRFNEYYRQAVLEFRRLDRLSPGDFLAWQNERLQTLISDAYHHVPYYHDLFRSLKLAPADIRTTADLSKLPVLTKEIVKKDFSRFINTRVDQKRILTAYTSGTTANPFKLFFDEAVLGRIFATPHAILEWFGLDFPAARKASFNVRKLTPLSQKTPPYWRTDRANKTTHFSIWHLNDDTFPSYLEEFNRVQPEVVYGFPGIIFQFVDRISRSGESSHRPKLVYSTAERLLPAFRDRIRAVWDCEICDMCSCDYTYTTATSPEGYNYVVSSYGIVRVLDREYESPVPVGERGHIVATTLINDVAPLINYVTNDLIALHERPSNLPRPYPVASTILGRWDDMVVCPDGRILNVVADALTKYSVGIRELQVVQNTLTDFVIHYVPASDFRPGYLQKMSALLEDLVGSPLNVVFNRYGTQIPRTPGGKLRTVISKIDPHRSDHKAMPRG